MYTTIQKVDGFCSILTFFMCAYVLANVNSLSKKDTCTYTSHPIWTDSTNNVTKSLRQGITNYKSEVDNFCIEKKRVGSELFLIQKEWGGIEYVVSYINYSDICYHAFYLLLFIFIISLCCQLYRTICYTEYEPEDTENIFGNYTPSSGPQLMRWMEYALTTPMEIVLIASSVFISDFTILLLLALLQTSLMLLGYLIECIIDRMENSDQKKQTRRAIVDTYVACIIFFVACVFHAVIWSVVFSRFYQQADFYANCPVGSDPMHPPKIPDIVPVIIWTQFVMFTLFGIVQLIHLYLAMYTYYPPIWEPVALAYSILSVTSKTLLGVFFIAYVQLNK